MNVSVGVEFVFFSQMHQRVIPCYQKNIVFTDIIYLYYITTIDFNLYL